MIFRSFEFQISLVALDNIHSMDKKELPLAVKLYEEVCDKNDVRSLNLSIFNLLRDSILHTKINQDLLQGARVRI